MLSPPQQTPQRLLVVSTAFEVPPKIAAPELPIDVPLVPLRPGALANVHLTLPAPADSPADPLPPAAIAPLQTELASVGFEKLGQFDLLGEAATQNSATLAGSRSETGRRLAVSSRGGTDESEQAVARALDWIAAHQLPDGGWSFDHRAGPCKGRCDHPGSLVAARVAATSMALLPLLGAGETHRAGKHRKQVQGGLSFLVHNMILTPDGGDLQAGGTMYSHALATIALCEAYAMSGDRSLHLPAQAALNFIARAQDPEGGGWRYTPGMPGDTSVLGWQLMALKSGHMSYLQVPTQTIAGASHFLDTVQREDGAVYGYLAGQDRKDEDRATTAVGLLARMYLGWKHDAPGLRRGVELLGKWGPSPDDLYYNYYATQVMHHYEGEPWRRWNEQMRDALVRSQVQKGHAAGSWFVDEVVSHSGGRLYCTAMAAMTLEVYYRHLPLYGKGSVDAFH